MRITLVLGDITRQEVDVVVNAANSSLLGGGGVDGAIHRRGGPEILADCRRLRASHYGGGLPTGQAVATTAGRLPARWVVHTVGPVYRPEAHDAELLASCYRESLRVAAALGARTVAFPAISTGSYRWPLGDAARIALTTVVGIAETGIAETGIAETGIAETGIAETGIVVTGNAVTDMPAPGAGPGAKPGVSEVRFVLFDQVAYEAFQQVWSGMSEKG